MDKNVYNKVVTRANGKCEICSRNYGLELHHILRRKVKETEYNCILLCWYCHRGTNGVHGKNGHVLDIKLKKMVQSRYFKKGYSEEKARKMMGGKLYG